MAKNLYTADTFKSLENLEFIKSRVTGFVNSRDYHGIIHMIKEGIDNSLDECKFDEVPDRTIYICIFRERSNHHFTILTKDSGRGIPSSILLNATTKLGTSGKNNENSTYGASAGLFGYGMKVAAALSTRYRNISSNYIEKVTASVKLKDGVIIPQDDKHKVFIEEGKQPQGLLTVYTPDVDKYFDGGVFMESGYLDLVALCKSLNIFNPDVNFQIYLYDRNLPEAFWTSNNAEALEIVNEFLHNKTKEVVYSSADVADKAAYLFDMWKVNSTVIFSDIFKRDNKLSKEQDFNYEVKLFITKRGSGNPQYFVAMNNVVLPEKTDNSITVTFMNEFRKWIANHITDEKYRTFVLEDYRFSTLLLALNANVMNAELGGVTKSTFKDQKFAIKFAEALNAEFTLRDQAYMQKLLSTLMPDIEQKYNQMYNVVTKKSDDKRVFLDIEHFGNYQECTSSDRSKCELFIVEGNSANNIEETRDNEFQAIYITRGVPVNATLTQDKLKVSRDIIRKDDIYHDLSIILNIRPETTDLSTSRFGKIIIATDADADGFHIRSLHLQNLYILNPRIITSGMVWLANAPLYSMDISKNKRFFLRNKTALLDTRIHFLYQPTFDIKIETSAGITELNDDLYRETCYMVWMLGSEYEKVAKQLNIEPIILERLTQAFLQGYLYPKINYLELGRCIQSSDETGYVTYEVNEAGNFIVISVGNRDYPIGLNTIGEMIRDHIYPLIKKYRVDNILAFHVRNKHPGAQFSDRYYPMSLVYLYLCFQLLNSKFGITRYKGLGEMDPADCYHTIMNPETRSITHITDIGDLDMNFAYVNKRDPSARKRLVAASGTLSSIFIKHNQFDFENDGLD